MSTTAVRTFKNKDDNSKMINQYKVIKTLGSGSFASVKLCVDTKTEIQYAIKQMNKKELRSKAIGNGRNAYDCVLDELNVMQRLEHPNIIWLHEIIDDPKKDSIFLVTEYHSKGSLGDTLSNLNAGRGENDPKIGLKRESVRLYLIDILRALHYCHKVIKVIHRDIKPDNIMVNHNDEAILIDFGVSALFDGEDDQMSHNMGT